MDKLGINKADVCTLKNYGDLNLEYDNFPTTWRVKRAEEITTKIFRADKNPGQPSGKLI